MGAHLEKKIETRNKSGLLESRMKNVRCSRTSERRDNNLKKIQNLETNKHNHKISKNEWNKKENYVWRIETWKNWIANIKSLQIIKLQFIVFSDYAKM